MAIAVVQHRSTVIASATSGTLAFQSNNTANNLLLYAEGENASSTSACTDSNSNTITNVEAFATGVGSRLDKVDQCNSGANTVTANNSVAANLHLHIWEFSGATAAPLDQHAQARQTGTAQSISTSGATAQANEMVFGWFYDEINNDSLTAGSSFSGNPSEFSNGGTGAESGLTEFKNVTSTGVQTADCTCGVGTSAINQIIATFKAAAAAATPTVPNDDEWQQQFSPSEYLATQTFKDVLVGIDYVTQLPPPPPFAIYEDVQIWCDWRALNYVDEQSAQLPPPPPFAIQEDENNQVWVDWRKFDYADEQMAQTPPIVAVPFLEFDDQKYQQMYNGWPMFNFADEHSTAKPPANKVVFGDIWLAKHHGTRIILPGYQG